MSNIKKRIKAINIYFYLSIVIIIAIIPQQMRFWGESGRNILIFIEFIFLLVYVYLANKKALLINNYNINDKKINISNYYIVILGALIMTFMEGFVYIGTGEINFIIIIIVSITLIPMINLDNNIKTKILK